MWIRKGFLIIALLSCLIIGFAVGALLKMDSAFDTGYKHAYMEMTNLLKEGSEGNVQFYISDMPFKFSPQSDRKAIQFTIAGAGDEGMRRTWEGN